MAKTLMEVMPGEFRDYRDSASYKHKDVEVASEHGFDSDDLRWPGKEKNVHSWVILTNGRAVGWNESASRGWSFPMITLKPEHITAYQDYSADYKAKNTLTDEQMAERDEYTEEAATEIVAKVLIQNLTPAQMLAILKLDVSNQIETDEVTQFLSAQKMIVSVGDGWKLTDDGEKLRRAILAKIMAD